MYYEAHTRLRALFVAMLCLIAAPLHPQDAGPRVAWLAENAVRIRSIDASDGDFRDLEPLRATLKDVRVVLLGEQTHGDGTTFLAKTRLIRFLHEEMGFDVLAFESGLYDCAKAWDLLVAGEAPQQAIPRGVFTIWTASREVQPLIEYLGRRSKSDRPLELAGVDSQLTGSASTEFLVPDLASFLSTIDPKLTKGEEWDRVVFVIGHLTRSSWEQGVEPVPSPKEQAAFAQTIQRWQRLILTHDRTPASRPWSGHFWRQFLDGLRVFAEQTWRTDYSDHLRNAAAWGMRDRQMGKNLVWLANQRYPNRKIIVWAATFHNARRVDTIEMGEGDERYRRLYAKVKPMGEVAWETLGDELYSLAITSYEGQSASAFAKAAQTILPASKDSLEDLFARAGFESAFIDFRRPPRGGRWLRAPIVAKLFGHKEMRGDWTRIVDGVVFIHTMQRSRKQVP